MDKMYLEVLKKRMEYFKGKKITELKDEEIQEYINLKAEIREIFKSVTQMWESLFREPVKKYRERVLNRE